MAGSILAYFQVIKGFKAKKNYLYSSFPIIGILMILYSIIFFNIQTIHPSVYTLLPVIGVCLIIWFSNNENFVTKILSTKLFVGIGLISYSLYIWHYPIFAFARISEYGQLYEVKILVLIFLVSFSIASYYFIEKPYRNKKNNFLTILRNLYFAVFIIFLFSLIVIAKEGKINKFNVKLEKSIMTSLFEDECKYSSSNINFLKDNFFKKRFHVCKKKYGKFILILGDSHSENLFNSFSKISDQQTFIIGLNRGGCRPYSQYQNNCHYLNALKFINKYKEDIKYIFFNNKGSYFLTNIGSHENFSDSEYRKLPLNNSQIKNTINYLNSIKNIKKELIFIGPHLEPNIPLTRRKIIDITI